jgi:tungstate transport system substrate-binding protein
VAIAGAILATVVLALVLTQWSALPWVQAQREIILATTTSTRDSGLLDVLIPMFEKQTKYIVKPVAVGSGQAIELGRKGEADLLLTHAPAAERQLVAEGVVSARRLVMHNDFVLVGPSTDPAAIRGIASAKDALAAVASSQRLFVSRGDDSGTHKMEKQLWQAAGLTPRGPWYQEAGAGMGDTLRIASEKDGYTLTDRGTYLALRGTLRLEIVLEGDPALLNIYHVMELNPQKYPKANTKAAKAFADFLLSPQAQQAIGVFGVDKYGSPLFFPDGGKTEEQLTGKPN